jgi:hypothetical protein
MENAKAQKNRKDRETKRETGKNQRGRENHHH